MSSISICGIKILRYSPDLSPTRYLFLTKLRCLQVQLVPQTPQAGKDLNIPLSLVLSLWPFSPNAAPWKAPTWSVWRRWSIHFCLGWTFHLPLKDSDAEGSWIWYKSSYLAFSMPLTHPVFTFSLHQFSALTPKVDAFSRISHFDTLCIFKQLAVTAENKERPWEMVLFFGSLLFLWRKLQCLCPAPPPLRGPRCLHSKHIIDRGIFFLETNACDRWCFVWSVKNSLSYFTNILRVMTFSVTLDAPVKPSHFHKPWSSVLFSGKRAERSLAAFSCPLSVVESVTKDFCLSLALLYASSES